MSLQIKKKRDRFKCPSFLQYVREQPCVICGAPSSASHLISVKWSTGSDALAVPACMINGHHVQSTRTSKRILELNGIDIPELHRKLWNGFLVEQGIIGVTVLSQENFEILCKESGFIKEK